MIKNCLVCKKEFYTKPARIKSGRGKYCSKACSDPITLLKGNPPIEISCLTCKKLFKIPSSRKDKAKFCSRKCLGFGRKSDPFWALWSKGKPRFDSRGENNPNWKGGTSLIREQLRKSIEYEEWRKSVFERDLYTCQICGEIGNELNADHIKPWSLFPKLRFDLSNGRTLCVECHKQTESYLNSHMKKEDFYG